jgi:uncharacterized protein
MTVTQGISVSGLPNAVLPPVPERIAAELGVGLGQVEAAVGLLDDGATVPFVARYRKEATGGLDDAQLRTLADRLTYLRDLEERRLAVLESVAQQGKLSEELAASIMSAETKARLEDVYLPYKPKRRTRAQIAREAGLEPLLDTLLADPRHNPIAAAHGYVDAERGVADADAALEGARAILVERFTEDADLQAALRQRVWSRGELVSSVREGKQAEGARFADWFDHREVLRTAPSHRVLALFRGEREGVLELTLDPDDVEMGALSEIERLIAGSAGITDEGRAADLWLLDGVRWAWRTRVALRVEGDIRSRLREMAEEEAVRVFAGNLRDLLLAAPAGSRPTMGLDPGLRTGVKVAVIDGTGKVVATDTIYPHPPARKWDAALARLAELAARHRVELIAIGNGTASRETERLAAELATRHPGLGLTSAVVSEAGASVYSASAYASAELPELDVSLRGAVSIARRLQDPLAELVKIDPKSIGVGQYQHDVSEGLLAHGLDGVVEDCVNAVGVDVNTASVPLLRRVSGVSEGLATMIVAHRDSRGAFRTRGELREVPRLGPKAFEQCAGFLRITGGEDPLDASAVHPEAYSVVGRMASSAGVEVGSLIGNSEALQRLSAIDFVDEMFGLPTVTDILSELNKPGRDPRPEFVTARFADGVEKPADLHRGMVLEGSVTNVAAFGAFVDIGVHQDGLVHVSQLSNSFVKDPRDVVTVGQVVKVRVLDVDVERKRISLTMKLEEPAEKAARGDRGGRPERGAKGERAAKPERGAKPERTARSERTARPERARGEREGRAGSKSTSDSRSGPRSGPKPGPKPGPRGDRKPGADRKPPRAPQGPKPLTSNAIADALRRAGWGAQPDGKGGSKG